MKEYLLVPKRDWSDLTNSEMTSDELNKYLGHFNPDDSKFMHGTGAENVPRKVIDADYMANVAVDNVLEKSDVADKYGKVIADGIFYRGHDAPPSILRDKDGQILYSGVRRDHPGRGIFSSIYEAIDTVASWLLRRPFESPYPNLDLGKGRSTTAPRFYEHVRLDKLNIPQDEAKSDQNTSKSVTVSTKDKKIWGPTHTEIISESGRTVIEIKEDHYRWVAPLRNLVETSISGTWIEKLVKPFYDLPLSPGLNSGTRVTVPDVDGKDIVIYEQRKKYNPRTLIGRHESEVTFYKDTESEAKATIKAECGFWRTYRLLNPYFYAEYLKMKVLGTPTEFPGGRHRMGGYDLGFFSPLESITISRTDKNGQKRKGMITVTDTLPHADPVYTLWKGTPEGSLLFNYDTLDKDEIYQDIITSRIWHVDPIVSHNMGKGSFSRDESGNIQVKYPNPKNHSEMKDLGRFEIDDDKCYFRLSKSRGIREFFSDRSDILIGDVRNEDGNINVYTDKKEIGHIVSQLKIKNIENAVYYKKKQVDVSESTGNIFGDLPTSDDFFTLDKSDAKKEKETREVLVPYINLDKLLREHKANIFTTPGEENAIEYMGMLIALLGVGAEDIGLANRDWELKKLNIYTVPKRIDRVLDLITATGKTHDLNQNIENVISVFIGPNLLPKKMGYALDDMLDVEPPEELSHHLSNIWEKN